MPTQEFVQKATKLLETLCETTSNFFKTLWNFIGNPIKTFVKRILGEEKYTQVSEYSMKLKEFIIEHAESITNFCKKGTLYLIIGGYVIFTYSKKALTPVYDYVTKTYDSSQETKGIFNKIKSMFNSLCKDLKDLWKNHPITVILYGLTALAIISLYSYVITTAKIYLVGLALLSLIPYLIPLLIVV
ncbi:MAG: hypothetical protein ACTSPI_00035 [Candidatus Heimdallarchaeaceae archaeon]